MILPCLPSGLPALILPIFAETTMNKNWLIIPHVELSAEALRALIEEFVTRDGTDYGEQEASLEQRATQVRQQLDAGKAVIVFDSSVGSVTIISRDQLPPGGLSDS